MPRKKERSKSGVIDRAVAHGRVEYGPGMNDGLGGMERMEKGVNDICFLVGEDDFYINL
jgi:hypothetical protein